MYSTARARHHVLEPRRCRPFAAMLIHASLAIFAALFSFAAAITVVVAAPSTRARHAAAVPPPQPHTEPPSDLTPPAPFGRPGVAELGHLHVMGPFKDVRLVAAGLLVAAMAVMVVVVRFALTPYAVAARRRADTRRMLDSEATAARSSDGKPPRAAFGLED
ncbi:hypothetical protein AMAG_09167 [Allomyces macrogynus ATCC 38327]|uniref:Transmembrane protein n=1 Tax=Allomyces macrogynus (strain ATCC 38327) TaxID=578462 RepID=A0A0L0SP12_ALLM3|nr:hypothetical protein AMAG_09167 [Allomyces macrogynus ATCC 38327]|eukprot:KNE64105.1 hypothetical protein AMAG_09167 [Allomyces macrogynus ATCC 38327]